MEWGLKLIPCFEAKFETRSPNKKKIVGSSGTTRGKIDIESRISGSYVKLKGKM